MNGLDRHEVAQRVSRAHAEQSGARTLSFSTTEVADYLELRPEGLCAACRTRATLVEIKTGEGRLSPRQKEVLPLLDRWVPVREEHWEVIAGRRASEHRIRRVA